MASAHVDCGASSTAACHPSAPAQQFRAADAAQAQWLIDQMIQQGAAVSAAQERAFIRYYTRWGAAGAR